MNLLLLSKSYEGKNLNSLKMITYGSEPMPAATLEKARSVFPHAVFKQTYGLIELGVFKTKSKSSDSLFLKIDPRDCLSRIVDGKLELKTETAMLGYLNAECPFTEDGWFKTGDLVEEDGEYIKILGRDSEVINVGGEKVFPIEVENVLLQFPNVEDAIVYKEPHPLIGNMVCAKIKLIEKEDEKQFIINLKKFCALNLARYKIPAKIKITEQQL
jgi:acyl-CoA synthetase (AMP-forming)/AMP-acid ligase II